MYFLHVQDESATNNGLLVAQKVPDHIYALVSIF